MARPENIELLVPMNDQPAPELSIVIPAMDEELTIVDFIAWCTEGLERAGVRGEILIVDSSADRTAELAVAAGARVLRVPKRGLGRAYIDAIPYIRGRWVLMGDADCTYDFRHLDVFVDALRGGADYVMGSRWKGSIEKGAMPPHHQYFGTPFTTWILNRVYSTHFSDIHCGMRAMTLDALKGMDIQSQSWEYASEIVIKSIHLDLVTTEVPVHFLKDREGRVSHHKRMGWFSPFQAAWINLRAMFVNGSDFFLVKPGGFFLVVGAVLLAVTTFGPVSIGSIQLSIFWQLLGAFLTLFGLNGLLLGLLARTLFDRTGSRVDRLTRVFAYNRTVLLTAIAFIVGTGIAAPLFFNYAVNGFDFQSTNVPTWQSHTAITGMTLSTSAATIFGFALIFHALPISRSYLRYMQPNNTSITAA